MGSAQLYICVTMGHNTNVLLLFLVLFGLCSVNSYKLIDDNLQDEEDPEWNQVIVGKRPYHVHTKPMNLYRDYSPEDLVKYGSGFRSLWDTNPYLDLEARSKRVHGALRFHRPWHIERAMLNNRRYRRNSDSWFG